MGTGHRQYRARIGKVGLDGFATEIEFRPFTPMGGTAPDEATSDAAFQAFVDFVHGSTDFEFLDNPSDMYPPQKWETVKQEVTPTVP